MIELTDRVAVVTGGASGIGRGICLVLAKCGADIAVADRNAEGAEQVAAEVAAMGCRSLARAVEVANKESVDKMVADVLAHFGKIDILVNNAGVGGPPDWYQYSTPREEDWDRVYQVNVKGVVLTSQVVASHMEKRCYGKIINIASIAGRQGRPFLPHYAASKAAVINLTQALAQQLAPYSINVNAICPGLVWTPLWEELAQRHINFDPDMAGLSRREVFDRVVQRMTLLKREQTAEDMGNLAAFLASDDACNITAQAINVDGGIRMN